MSEIGARLRAERERLGFIQDAFAQQLGISKRSLINYEKSERSPDAEVLAAAAPLGVDVLFVITGQRSQPVPATAGLSRRAAALLDNFEHTDEAGKKIIEGTATLAAQSKKAAHGGGQ